MLAHPDLTASVMPEWFTPAFWGVRAEPVGSGGRGAAWFLNAGKTGWILRCYERGGLAAHFSNDMHWFTGRDSVRSFSEFHLLYSLHNLGLPVPKPVAAGYHRTGGFWYRAQIIVERLPGATPFSDHLVSADISLWHDVGRLIRYFHDWGVCHADLNCHNILIADSGLYLIDFDKSRIRPGSRWKQGNLKRLRRSVRKILNGTDPAVVNERWHALLGGYGVNNQSDYNLNMLIPTGLLPFLGTVAGLEPYLMLW